jgi:hypothetical protein
MPEGAAGLLVLVAFRPDRGLLEQDLYRFAARYVGLAVEVGDAYVDVIG